MFAVGIGVAIGFAINSGTDAGTWLLASATGALAIFTAAMALATRRSVGAAERTAKAAETDIRQGADLVKIGQDQVKEAQRQVELASRALDADRQPLLVPTTTLEPWDHTKNRTYKGLGGSGSNAVQEFPVAKCWIDPGTDMAWIVLKFKNVGRGTALLTDGAFSAAITMETEAQGEHPGHPYSVTVAPQADRLVVAFSMDRTLSAMQSTIHRWVQEGNAFSVEIRYADIGRRHLFTTLVMYGGSRPDPDVFKVEVTEE